MKNEKLKPEIFKRVKKNILLKNHTTFKIGGQADYFFKANSKEDLVAAVKWARRKKLPFFILGGGSNVLFPDEGYRGLVIKVQSSKLKIKSSKGKLKIIEVEGGVKLSDLVSLAVEQGLTGLEWAVGIPGTVGGAVRGNITAFGEEIKDLVREVEVFDVDRLKVKKFKNSDCQFGYEESVFKKKKNLIILSSIFQLKKGGKLEIKNKASRYLNYRRRKHPRRPSAGCMFKNCPGRIKDKRVLEKFPELEEFNKKGEIPSSYLIDRAGLKGRRIGGAEVSKKHANFIINQGGAKARDVLKLTDLVKKKVKEKFNIDLKEEVQIVHS